MANAAWIKDVIVFLIAAGIIVPLFHRARIGTVLGFLVVGVIVGPNGLIRYGPELPATHLLLIHDPSRVEPFAELGVIFLLFLIGLEFSLDRLWSLRRYVLGIGLLQVLLTALVIGTGTVMLGLNGSLAVVLGLCLALSSTALVMQILVEQHRSGGLLGRVSLSVLLFQDLMVAPILFIVGFLGGGAFWASLAIALAQAVMATAAILVVGRYLLRPLLHVAGRTGSRDLIMATTLLIVAAVVGGFSAAGLSAALGAFLAGLLLGETEYRHHIEVDIEPFKGLLLGVFFMSVGMSIDPGVVIGQFGALAAALTALLATKAATQFLASRALGVPRSIAAESAILLAQSSEFAFVGLALAGSRGLMTPEAVQFTTLLVGLSMMVTPILARLARVIGRRLEDRSQVRQIADDAAAAGLTDHVIIGGFGRVGQTVARVLEEEGVPYVALDADGARVNEHRQAGKHVYFGDASRVELLERMGAKRARAFVVTVDTPATAEHMISAILKLRRDALVFARAKDPQHAQRLLSLGAVGVIPEAVEASLQLAARVLEGLDLPEDAVAQRVAQARQEELGKLVGSQ